MISDRDFNKIAALGNFRTSDEKADLRRFLNGCLKDIFIVQQHQSLNLSHKQQLRLLQHHVDWLNTQIEYFEANPQVVSVLAAVAHRRASKMFKGAQLERVLARISEQTSAITRSIKGLKRKRDRVLKSIALLESDPLLPVITNAAKPDVDHLARSILIHLRFSGKLGPKMPSESDWQVKFAREVFNVLLKDTLQFSASRQSDTWTLGAVRKRLAAHFDDVQSCFKGPQNLKRERARRSNYRYRLRVEFRKVPHVSEQDARDLSDSMPIDLTLDPKEVVRQEVASWPT